MVETAFADGSVELTLKQKQSFYSDGFIVLKNAVPKEMTHRARRVINLMAGKIVAGTHEAPWRKYRYVGSDEAISKLPGD